ncbi:hypothetical protein K435DRAFT_874639 [Dendrothele bispora CBS 962.96]|uniref:Uncharacterized protein n=1 Tax=Dendrothele bispora (strain CBS 962.96) TaxID=1314807 RepID=A0A4S8KWD9_DENBC|nr:hypothetical protein K435DRAFT_874639 [Dendrothele bispora CBS 962.96]
MSRHSASRARISRFQIISIYTARFLISHRRSKQSALFWLRCIPAFRKNLLERPLIIGQPFKTPKAVVQHVCIAPPFLLLFPICRKLVAHPFDIIARRASRDLVPTMSSVTADSFDTVDNATIVQDNQADGSAMTVANVDVPGPLASGGTSATTVTQEEDTQVLRNVSPGTRTSITVAQSMQMFNGSSQIEFTDSVLSNVGGNKNETNNVYHIYGNPNIYCSSTDLGALRVNSVGSSEVLRGATSSRPEHVNHGDMNTATSTEENESANSIQTSILTPLGVKGDSSACEDQAGCSDPRTQGKEDQQTTPSPAADRDQTSKSG